MEMLVIAVLYIEIYFDWFGFPYFDPDNPVVSVF